jgi:peptidoglycan-N-acetylglucosamine deacetylase
MKFKFLPHIFACVATVAALSQCAMFQKKQPVVLAPRTNLQQQGLPPMPGSGGRVSGAKNYTMANVNGPYIAMTFDDGPHGALTPRLLDILAARNIRATFYVVGENVKRQPNLMRRMAASGHEFGNHTWTHPLKPSTWADAPLRSEIQRTADIITSTSGAIPRSYRPPGGSVTPHQREWLFRDYGYPTILWAVDPNDWKRPGPAVVTSRILNATRPGYIVLAHDIHPGTIEAMPATLDGLLARGYRFLTISQLLGAGAQHVATVTEPKQLTMSFSPGGF